MPTPFRQRSFAAGELSRRVQGRDDLAKYAIGLRRSRNGFVSAEGAWHNRPGTLLVSETKESLTAIDRGVRLVPFVFSEAAGQAYVLEFGQAYLRIIAEGAYVEDPLNPGNPLEVPTTYTADQLARLKFVQIDDVVRLTHPAHPPRELRRYAHDDWRLVDTSFKPPAAPKLMVQAALSGWVTGGLKQWAITVVYADGTESLPRFSTQIHMTLSAASYVTLTGQVEWTWIFPDPHVHPRPVAIRFYRGAEGKWAFLEEIAVRGPQPGPLPDTHMPFTFKDDGLPADLTVSAPDWATPWSRDPAPWAPSTVYYAGDLVEANGNVYRAKNAGRSAEYGTGPSQTGGLDGIMPREPNTVYAIGAKMTIWGYRYRCVAGLGATDGSSLGPCNWQIAAGLVDGALTWNVELDDGGTDSTVISDPITWEFVSEAPAKRMFPASVCYFGGRLGFARTDLEPSLIRLSAVDDFLNFTRPLIGAADSALDLPLLGRRREEIRWLLGLDRLVVGTQSSVWAIGSSGGAAVTTRAFDARVQSEAGASWLDPLLVPPDVLLYVRTKGCGVRDLVYDDGRGKFVGNDLVVLARHLFTGYEIVDWAYAGDPWSIVWAVRSDGRLLSLTYQREQDVWAWSRHDTEGLVENVCAIPEGDEDAVYLCVKRQRGDGTWHRYIERMASRVVRLDEDDALTAAECVFVDCGVTVRAVPSAGDGSYVEIAGLGHHEGLEVVALADGEVIDANLDGDPLVVTAGKVQIATDDPAGYDVVHVGLAYTSELELLPLTVQGQARHQVKKVVRVVLELEDSLGFEVAERIVDRRGVATPDAEWHEWDPREVEDGYDPLELFTGDVSLSQFSSWNRAGTAAIRQRLPLPLTVLAATREAELGGS